MKILGVLWILPALASGADTRLQFVPVANVNATGAVPLANGSVFVFGSKPESRCEPIICNSVQTPVLTVLDPNGNATVTAPDLVLGGGNSVVNDAAVDGGGNIWIAGETDSDDFPLVRPLFNLKAAYQAIGFVAKLDPSLRIVFSTFVGENTTKVFGDPPYRIALDRAGNAYVAGSTDDPNFPTTGPVFGTGAPPDAIYTFLSRISADGSRLLWSRLLGGSGPICNGGSACTETYPETMPLALAVDALDNLVVGGTTTAEDFPITKNVYGTGGGAFVARVAADGSQLLWSTEVGTAALLQGIGLQNSTVHGLVLDPAGDVFVAGTAPSAIATTPGALQTTASNLTPAGAVQNGFALKLSADGTQLLYATNLASTYGVTITGLALNGLDNVWIAGNIHGVPIALPGGSPPSGFPGIANTPATGLDFALQLNADATALTEMFPLLPGTLAATPAFDSDGSLLLLGSAGNLLRLNPATAYSAPALFAITDAAIPRAAAGVNGGEIITLYGVGLGPATPIVAAPDSNGVFPKELGGVSVHFGDFVGSAPIAAPLLYVGPNQINLQAPFRLAAPLPITVAVTTPTGNLPRLQLVQPGSIGIFGVVNQDGSLNSASHPAPAGSIVSVYATGLRQPLPSAPDGIVATSAFDAFHYTIQVSSDRDLYPLPLFYAGAAPGLINGVAQVNVQLPAQGPSPTLTIERLFPFPNGAPGASNPVLVYVQ